MNTLVVSATKKSSATETLLHQSLTVIKESGAKFHALFHLNNSRGLSELYNESLNADTEYDCIVYIHDDVYIDDLLIFEKINDAFKLLKYDIVGIAGGSKPAIKEPALWHLMTDRNTWRGAAGHFVQGSDQIHITSFGPMPAKVDILDGVLIAVNRKPCTAHNWSFNENYKFHHYDIASTLDATQKGLVCGVLPIHIIHASPGLLDINDAAFQASQRAFLTEYNL